MSPPAFLSPEIAKRFRGLNPGNASHFTGRKQEGGISSAIKLTSFDYAQDVSLGFTYFTHFTDFVYKNLS